MLGALGRIGVGQLSDMVGSRVRPLRWVGIAAGVTMALLGLAEPLTIAVVLLVVASTVTVADNGLAFTGVAERAGSYWSGRALGVQNTAQYLTAAAAAPVAGLAITHWGYAATFGFAALFPLVAMPLVPRRTRPRRRAPSSSPRDPLACSLVAVLTRSEGPRMRASTTSRSRAGRRLALAVGVSIGAVIAAVVLPAGALSESHR